MLAEISVRCRGDYLSNYKLFAGSLTSILAFACPLAYLIPLLNASILLKCSFYSTLYLYNLLKRDFIVSNSPTLTTSNKNNNYSKLRNQSRMKRSSSYKLKVMMDLLPRFLRNSPLNQSESSRSVKSSKTRKGKLFPSTPRCRVQVQH